MLRGKQGENRVRVDFPLLSARDMSAVLGARDSDCSGASIVESDGGRLGVARNLAMLAIGRRACRPRPNSARARGDFACARPETACTQPGFACARLGTACVQPGFACARPGTACAQPGFACARLEMACAQPISPRGRRSEACAACETSGPPPCGP